MHKIDATITLNSSIPANGATNVARDTKISLDFSPDNACVVSNPSYPMELRKASDHTLVETIDYGSAVSGAPIVFSRTVTLDANTTYYVDVIESTLYNCIHEYEWNPVPDRIYFTTGTCLGDGTCPLCYPVNAMVCCATPEEASIKHLSPPDNAHFMQSYEGLSITFNGNTSVATGNIVIKKYGDDSIVETIDVTSNKVTGWGTPTITINPSANLEANTQYYVNFPIDGYRDAAAKDAWNFWTKSTPNTFSGTGL